MLAEVEASSLAMAEEVVVVASQAVFLQAKQPQLVLAFS
jgi:hypothetical protein